MRETEETRARLCQSQQVLALSHFICSLYFDRFCSYTSMLGDI